MNQNTIDGFNVTPNLRIVNTKENIDHSNRVGKEHSLFYDTRREWTTQSSPIQLFHLTPIRSDYFILGSDTGQAYYYVYIPMELFREQSIHLARFVHV